MPNAVPWLIIINKLDCKLHIYVGLETITLLKCTQIITKIMDQSKTYVCFNAILIQNFPPGCSIMTALQNWPSDGTTTISLWFCHLHCIFNLSVWQHKIPYHLESKGFNTAYHMNEFSTLVTILHFIEIFICGASCPNPPILCINDIPTITTTNCSNSIINSI